MTNIEDAPPLIDLDAASFDCTSDPAPAVPVTPVAPLWLAGALVGLAALLLLLLLLRGGVF